MPLKTQDAAQREIFLPGKLIIKGPTKCGNETVSVRTMARTDKDIVAGAFGSDWHPTRLTADTRNRIISDMLRGKGMALVARVDGAYAGVLEGVVHKDPIPGWTREDHYIYIGLLYVTPRQREKGVAGYLVDVAINALRQLKLKRISLYTTNHVAMKLYLKKGFVLAEGYEDGHAGMDFLNTG